MTTVSSLPHRRSLRLKVFASVAGVIADFALSVPSLVALLWLPLVFVAVTAVALEWLYEELFRASSSPDLAFQLATVPLAAMSGVLILKHKLLTEPLRSINLDMTKETWIGSIYFGLAALVIAGFSSAFVRLVTWLVVDRGFSSEAFWNGVTIVMLILEPLVGAVVLTLANAALLGLVMRRAVPASEFWHAICSQFWPILAIGLILGAILKLVDVAYNVPLSLLLPPDTTNWLFDPASIPAARALADNLLFVPLNFILLSVPAIAAATLFTAYRNALTPAADKAA